MKLRLEIRHALVAVLAVTGFPLFAAAIEPGATIFSDGFDSVGTFAENWESKPGTKSEGGVVKSDGQLLRWRGEVPDEYVVEADFRVSKDYQDPPEGHSHWLGFWVDGQRFQFQPIGYAFVIANGCVNYTAIADYARGDWVHLAVEKKKAGSTITFHFTINGTTHAQFADTKDERHDPIDIQGYGTGTYELDNFVVSRVRHEDDSNNLAYNGGFEADEDGVPLYYNFLGDFEWSRPLEEYETDYLGRYTADREVKHSGEQSLKVALCPACSHNSFWPWQVGGTQGKPAVMSVWMKTDIPDGIDVEMTYGASRTVHVAGDWARYEVATTNLGAKSTYSRGQFTIRNTAGIRGNVWFDDLQAENIPMPEGGTFDYANQTYATPFKASELDKERLNRAIPSPPEPDEDGFRHPAAYRPGVLGRLDYYMNEKEVAWRVTDADGNAKIVTKPMDEIPMGTNAVSFTLDGNTYTDTVVRLPYRTGVTQVNRWTRSLVHDGENLVFTGLQLKPVGSPYDDHGANFARMFELLKSKGFRHAQVLTHLYREAKYPMPAIDKTIACLDAAKAYGFKILNWWGSDALIGEVGGEPEDENALDLWEVMELYSNYDNILSHLVLDEPELSKTSEWAQERLEWVKSYYPYMPVQMNNSVLGIPKRFAGLKTDVLMIDDYLTNGEERDVAGVVGNMDEMLWADDAKPCWFFVVGDNLTLHYKSPNYGEQIAQSWGMICSGGSGVSWYIDFPHIAGSWNAMVDVNREVQQLAPALLSEELCGQSTSSAPWNGIRHLTRKHEGAIYLFTVNLYEGEMADVTFTLPDGAPENGAVEVLYENRTIPLEKGVFTDSYAGHVRHVYKIVPGAYAVRPEQPCHYDDPQEATNAAQYINAHKDSAIVVPSVAQGTKSTYVSRVAAAVAAETNVVIVLDSDQTETFQTELDDELKKTNVVSALTCPTNPAVSIQMVPGFYYWIDGGTSPLSVTTHGAAVLGAGGEAQSVAKPVSVTGDRAFYRLCVGVSAP